MQVLNRVLGIAASAFLLYTTSIVASENNNDELLMGVAPIMSSGALFKRLAPLRDHLSQEMGRKVVLELTSSPKQLTQRMGIGRYDLVFTGPNFALQAFDSGLYVPGVIPGNITSAVLVSSESSPITTIDALKGKTVSTPRKEGIVATIAPAFFKSKGFKSSEIPQFIHYASHNAAFMASQSGDVDAAFIAEFGFRDAQADNSLFKEIDRTKPFPGVSLIIAKSLPESLREKMISAVVQLNEDADGILILRKIAFPAFRRYSADEFEKVRGYFADLKIKE